MTKARSHKELRVWQEAMELVNDIYRLTKTFPKEEAFALTSQMRRAAVSIPSNIAEGAARLSKREFKQYLSIARGSLAELETPLLIAVSLGYIESSTVDTRMQSLFKLLSALMRTLHDD